MNGKDIIKDSIIVDGLFHSLLKDPPFGNKTMYDALIDGGVTALNATVLLDYYKNTFDSFVQELYQYFVLEETLPDKVLIVKSTADIELAKQTGKLGIILGTQGSDCLEHDLRYVTILHKLGVRIIQITYNTRCNIGCGVFEPNDTGLGRFGQQVIFEMNRLGILADLSHVGYKTSMDAIELSEKPCVFTHVGVKKLNPNVRNIQDDQIKAVCAKGGVVGLCPHSIMNVQNPGEWPTVEQFVDQIMYVIDMCGEDAAGIGTDRWMRPTMSYKMLRTEFERTLPNFFGGFSESQKHVNGFNYYDEWDNLAEALLARNLSDTQVKKVLGGNFMRVFKEVWG